MRIRAPSENMSFRNDSILNGTTHSLRRLVLAFIYKITGQPLAALVIAELVAGRDQLENFVHIPVKPGSDRTFGFLVALVFLVMGGYPYFSAGGGVQIWYLATGVAFGVIALLYPRVLHQPNRYWVKLGLLLGKFISPIILSVIFFLVITPLAIIARISGYDSLKLRKPKTGIETYWIERDVDERKMIILSDQY
ncbi:SxtJ family membrane protein [Parasphingorhabdus sp.]|uniref:SxtJ family membrane protein n=1 Tax=Parasphingorhabdus sp. TaxID=2709688 RepID=UPI002B265D1A|nr:SxtJ family membrane protein [Parasphingorhabdus sp.]